MNEGGAAEKILWSIKPPNASPRLASDIEGGDDMNMIDLARNCPEENFRFQDAEGSPDTSFINCPNFTQDFLSIRDFNSSVTEDAHLQDTILTPFEQEILQLDVLSMLQPEDIDPALLTCNFDFDFDFPTSQPYIIPDITNVMNPGPTIPTILDCQPLQPMNPVFDVDITDTGPSLPASKRRRRKTTSRRPARSRRQTRQNIRIPLTIAPQFLRPTYPEPPRSMPPDTATQSTQVSIPTSGPETRTTIFTTTPSALNIHSTTSSRPSRNTTITPHTSTYPIPNPPPSYPHTHAVHFQSCGHISLTHVYRRLPRPRTKLCICPNIPDVLPKIYITNTDESDLQENQNSDNSGRIIGAGMELEVDATGVCDDCVGAGRRTKRGRSRSRTTVTGRAGAWRGASAAV
ncbi:hypothetical protein Dda_2242 [Drechslerella dactyloides]|uniref:Uncharacterized protein n=1 Tax=Drechslerella dactyloides TaxID=74499 RepID=A0AAD6J3B5_DREDA|nr:hypothetical protein Dda_2242 [Drechslerella dactyloides]